MLKPIPLSTGEEPSDPAEVEIGWHLHPDAWGRGYATEAAAAVSAAAFARGQGRIIAVTHPDNHASQAVCRRIGMRHRGTTTRYLDMSSELFEPGLGAMSGIVPHTERTYARAALRGIVPLGERAVAGTTALHPGCPSRHHERLPVPWLLRGVHVRRGR